MPDQNNNKKIQKGRLRDSAALQKYVLEFWKTKTTILAIYSSITFRAVSKGLVIEQILH